MLSRAAALRATASAAALALAGSLACTQSTAPRNASGTGGGGAPFAVDPRFPGCLHPAVSKSCADGWCRIPAGCFVMGSPESEPGRGPYTEQQATVTLTRAFEIGATEVTLGAWRAAGFADPVYPPEDPYKTCGNPTCPVLTTSWFDALAYANALSERAGLEPCYVLRGCRGVPGGRPATPAARAGDTLACDSAEITAATVYACRGYRLPTGAEWEYAARAGTTGAFYSGGVSADRKPDVCYPEANLLSIGWFCANAPEQRPHPAGLKRPNAWGLFDVIGNAMEWASENHDGRSLANPSTDPYGALSATGDSNVRGGGFTAWPDILRVANIGEGGHQDRGTGFRLARTLP